MALRMDVVCTDRCSANDRREKTVRAIGEILPFVLAKYGVSRANGDSPETAIATAGVLRAEPRSLRFRSA